MIVTGRSELVAAWAGRQLGCRFVPPYEAIGIVDRNGLPCGAAVFNDCADRNIELTCVGHGWTPRIASEIARYCFDRQGCERITMRTREGNADVRNLIERMGARQEGILRRWYGDENAVIYGLLKDECRIYKRASR